MTNKRLEEIKTKFESNEGTIQDINEILTDFFVSFSQHIKDIKKQLSDIQVNQQSIYKKLDALENPVYTFIQSDNEDDELIDNLNPE